MKLKQLLAASVLGLASTAASAIVWTPDVNTSTGDFQEVTFLNFNVDATTYDLIFYDAGSAPSAEPSATSISMSTLSGIVEISANPAPYTATLQGAADNASLGATALFELALYDGTSYIPATAASPALSGNAYFVEFGPGIQGEILGVDLAPIPVPAAVWLFGSGLLGLVGVARRRA